MMLSKDRFFKFLVEPFEKLKIYAYLISHSYTKMLHFKWME